MIDEYFQAIKNIDDNLKFERELLFIVSSKLASAKASEQQCIEVAESLVKLGVLVLHEVSANKDRILECVKGGVKRAMEQAAVLKKGGEDDGLRL